MIFPNHMPFLIHTAKHSDTPKSYSGAICQSYIKSLVLMLSYYHQGQYPQALNEINMYSCNLPAHLFILFFFSPTVLYCCL